MKLNFPALFLVAGLSSSAAMLRAQMPPGPAQAVPEQASPASATAATTTPPAAAAAPTDSAKASPKTYIVPSGTKLPLILHNSITTRNAKPGDPVYLETLFPVVIDNRRDPTCREKSRTRSAPGAARASAKSACGSIP